MSVFENFIKECLNASAKEQSPLHLLIAQTRYCIATHSTLSKEQKDKLDLELANIDAPIQIAIIGQFSSGKSTFLNALLGEEILPSGVTPVTAKVCYIKYGKNLSLEATYKNGKTYYKDLDFLHSVDSLENQKIKFYTLFAPLDLLKTITFLDTPGFNSQNQSDTDTTNAVLDSVDGIIWLSLIDNVGKNSEKQILQTHIKRYANKSLCVLNQKDRLSNAQVQTSLEYAKSAFAGFFEQIEAISARNALLYFSNPAHADIALLEDSNINAVLSFINTFIAPKTKNAKLFSTKKHLRILLDKHICSHIRRKNEVHKLIKILQDMRLNLESSILDSAFFKQFVGLFFEVETCIDSVARDIFDSLKKQSVEFKRVDKGLLGNKEITYTKPVTMLPKEALALKLLNPESSQYKDFIKLSFKIANYFQGFENLLDSAFSSLKEQLQSWYAQYNFAESNNEFSETGFLSILTSEYEKNFTKHINLLKHELESIRQILSLNYQSTICLCLESIDNKILQAISKHRQSPDTLPLFNPSLENIREYLNVGFCFLRLQDKMYLTDSLHKKALRQLLDDVEKENKAKFELIDSWLKKENQALESLKNQRSLVREFKG